MQKKDNLFFLATPYEFFISWISPRNMKQFLIIQDIYEYERFGNYNFFFRVFLLALERSISHYCWIFISRCEYS